MMDGASSSVPPNQRLHATGLLPAKIKALRALELIARRKLFLAAARRVNRVPLVA
jgi:hypothetical protein